MQGGDEEAAGHADALLDVVVLPLRPLRVEAEEFGEHDDDPGHRGQERFPPVRAQRLERLQPLVRHAPTEIAVLLFGLRRLPDPCLDPGVADRHEPPRLAMRPRRRGRRSLDRPFDQPAGHRLVGEEANAPPAVELLEDPVRPALHFPGLYARRPIGHEDRNARIGAPSHPPARARPRPRRPDPHRRPPPRAAGRSRIAPAYR